MTHLPGLIPFDCPTLWVNFLTCSWSSTRACLCHRLAQEEYSLGWEASPSLTMVVVSKVKRGKKDDNRGSTGVLQGQGKRTVKIRGTVMLRGIGVGAWSLEQETGVDEKGTVIPGSVGWSYQIFGSKFQGIGFWHGCAKWNKLAVLDFWFSIFDDFLFFYEILGMCLVRDCVWGIARFPCELMRGNEDT